MKVAGFAGFSGSGKTEVWREASGVPVRYPVDAVVVAFAADSPRALPEAALRPVLDLNRADDVAAWLLDNAERFEYRSRDQDTSPP